MKHLVLLLTMFCGCITASSAESSHPPHYPKLADGSTQYASFPIPPEKYPPVENSGLADTLLSRAKADPFNVAASVIFFLAIIHTFAAGYFSKLAHKFEHRHDEELKKRGVRDADHPDGVPEVSFLGTLFHFLGEIEAIFGLWVIALAGAAIYFHSWLDFGLYLSKDRAFIEPLFVVVIMAIAASRPVLLFAERLMSLAASIGKGTPAAWWFSVLTLAPILGSFITEPAAITIGALLLAKKFYRYDPPARLAYATLGLLFVNISIGGTLTHFAAPPVLMVAGTWKWDTPYMFYHFGWKAAAAIFISSSLYFMFFRKALAAIAGRNEASCAGKPASGMWQERETPVPFWITAVHIVFLGWTVFTAHFPVLFIGGFLFFLAFITATRHHQNEVSLRSPILVGFFLASLVIHGGCQAWWIGPVMMNLSTQMLMLGATVLTAFNDNAAITYLAAQVPGIGTAAKYAVVAGAVTGGGLTVIANAPNPAGQSILTKFFKGGISPLGLLLGALIPTAIAYLCFVLLPDMHDYKPDPMHGVPQPTQVEIPASVPADPTH